MIICCSLWGSSYIEFSFSC